MMAATRKVVEIDDSPDLIRLVDDLRTSRVSTVLRSKGEDVAVVTPLKSPARGRRRLTDPDKLREALQATAGGWRGLVDTDKLIEDIYADRNLESRPLPEL